MARSRTAKGRVTYEFADVFTHTYMNTTTTGLLPRDRTPRVYECGFRLDYARDLKPRERHLIAGGGM